MDAVHTRIGALRAQGAPCVTGVACSTRAAVIAAGCSPQAGRPQRGQNGAFGTGLGRARAEAGVRLRIADDRDFGGAGWVEHCAGTGRDLYERGVWMLARIRPGRPGRGMRFPETAIGPRRGRTGVTLGSTSCVVVWACVRCVDSKQSASAQRSARAARCCAWRGCAAAAPRRMARRTKARFSQFHPRWPLPPDSGWRGHLAQTTRAPPDRLAAERRWRECCLHRSTSGKQGDCCTISKANDCMLERPSCPRTCVPLALVAPRPATAAAHLTPCSRAPVSAWRHALRAPRGSCLSIHSPHAPSCYKLQRTGATNCRESYLKPQKCEARAAAVLLLLAAVERAATAFDA